MSALRRTFLLGAALVVSGCDLMIPSAGPSAETVPLASMASAALEAGPPLDRVHLQAEAALQRWAAAAAAGGDAAIGIVGERTGQIGDWEVAVGDNNKPALMAGLVLIAGELPSESPPPGTVTWADGTTASVPVLTAAEALDALKHEAMANGGACDACTPLAITSARLVDGPIETSQGPATGPIWQFTVDRTRVIVTEVAIGGAVSVEPPVWDPNDPPEGMSIDSAIANPADAILTVQFIGAPGTAAVPCGADYTADAVESDLAVVVIVTEQRHAPNEACPAVGAVRTATVNLAKPLGGRAVLEVREGRPVPLEPPR